MFFSNKKRQLTPATAPKVKPLKLTVEIKLERTEDYGSEKTLVQIERTETLDHNTDARIRDIKDEVATQLQEVFEKTLDKIEGHDQLTDGFHAELAKAKESGKPAAEQEANF